MMKLNVQRETQINGKLKMVTETSILAYVEVLQNLGARQLLVLKAIDKLSSCNNLMISKYLNLPINSVTPRVNELRKKGLIVKDTIRKCPYTKRMTQFWRFNKKQEI